MQAIERPFRFTWDFCVVWALLVLPVFFLTRSRDIDPWYSEAALLILAPMFATFVLYGPVLLVRQVVHPGARGWFVLRVLLSVLLVAVLLFGGLLLSGVYTESRARILGFVFTAVATVYLSWRLEKHERNEQRNKGDAPNPPYVRQSGLCSLFTTFSFHFEPHSRRLGDLFR